MNKLQPVTGPLYLTYCQRSVIIGTWVHVNVGHDKRVYRFVPGAKARLFFLSHSKL